MPKRESPESHSVPSWLPHQQQTWKRPNNPALLRTNWEVTGTAPIMPFSSVSGSHRSPESSPLGSGHTLSCPPVLSHSAPQTVHCALWPKHKQLLKNSVFSNFSEHPLPSAASIPFQTLTGLPFSLLSGGVFCPTSLLPEPWVLNSVTSSQFLPPASAIHVCGSVHSGLKTWVQSLRATHWKERTHSC